MSTHLLYRRLIILLFAILAPPSVAYAHVKWFSEFNYTNQPRTLTEIVTPIFTGLVLLSMFVIALLVPLDRWTQQQSWWKRMSQWLALRQQHSTLLMRIAVGATLLLAWQADSLLTPELRVPAAWLGWMQFGVALLLLSPETTPLAGIGIFALYFYGILETNFFYMLDYVHYIGIGIFLMLSTVNNLRIRALALPILYFAVGFCLMWLGMEKLVYPEWAQHLLNQHPVLTLGLPVDFFLIGAAFVEFALGYLLMIGLFERPLAITITFVFFLTTLVFGKLEVMGHLPLHAALLVFLLHGPGTVYQPPIAIEERQSLRMVFAAINFPLLLAIVLPLYIGSAWIQFAQHGG